MAPRPARSIDSDDVVRFHERVWSVQRVGWMVLLGVVLAALCGVFGDGPLARARANRDGVPFWLEYERFSRRGAHETLRVHLESAATRDARTPITLAGDFLEHVQIESVMPEPIRSEAREGSLTYEFETRAAGETSGSDRTATLTFHIRHVGAGRLHGTVRAGTAAALDFAQLVYP